MRETPFPSLLQRLLYTAWQGDDVRLAPEAVWQATEWRALPTLQQQEETLTSQWPTGTMADRPLNMEPRGDVFPGVSMHLPQDTAEMRPLQVLLVEDNATDVFLLQDMLTVSKGAKFQVTHVEALQEALQQLAAQRFDVVLLDLSLPDSLGLDTFTTLRAQGWAVPIVVLTGLDDETLAVDAVKAGAQDYLVKGQVDGPLLVRAIRYAIERQRAEAALRHQRDWLQVTLSSIGDAVIATDTHGMITFINPVAVSLTGWSSQEALGRHINEVFSIVNEQTRQRVESPVLRALHEGTSVALSAQTVLMARDGHERPITNSGAPIRGADGSLHGAVLVFRDMSERKRLEEQLRQAQKMEAIGTLAGGIAHDFNNILTAILGYAELATRDVPPVSPVQSYLDAVITAGTRARDLIRQILAFSRRTEVARSPVELSLLVNEALGLLRASLPSTIEVRHRLAPTTCAVLADLTQMHQVLMNLCANAEYAMRQTGGVLEIGLEAIEVSIADTGTALNLSPGPYVRLTVRDTGPGIMPEVLTHIFEPFFTTKNVGEGTGMGLSVVHGIVTSHGGIVTVSSVLGQGATFEVYLPRCLTAVTEQASHTGASLPTGTGCILLVDDEASVAYVEKAHLERLNYEVVTCLSSAEALEVFRAAPQRFDLVVTDQTMPQMTGDALAQALRHIRPDIPIILCTGFSHTMDPERANSLGIDAWMAKPWQAHEFVRTIQDVMEQRRNRKV